MPGLRVATWDEVLAYGRPGLRSRGLLPPMAGGAGFALVGTIGAATQGATAAAVTPAWGTGESRTAGNTLVCWVAGGGSAATLPTTPTGWSVAAQVAVGTVASATILYTTAAGGDAAPTIAGAASVRWSVTLGEFSGGASASVLDQHGTNTGSTSPLTATCGAADQLPGEVVIYCNSIVYSVAATKTITPALNNGASVNDTSNATTSTGSHYDMGYGITTGNASADTSTLTYTTTNISGAALAVASFRLMASSAFPTRRVQRALLTR